MKKIKFLLILFLLFVDIKSVWASNDIYLDSSNTELELMIDDTNTFNDVTNRTLEYTYHGKKSKEGLWFSNSKDKEGNYINIKEYSSKKMIVDFIINNYLFKDVSIDLINNKGKIDTINNEHKYLKGYLSFKDSKYVSISINSNSKVYGLVGDFAKNNSLKYIDCLSNNFEVFKEDNRILFESIKGIDKGLIGICKFEKNDNDIGYFYLNNINISDGNKEIIYDNAEIKITEPKIDDIIYHKLYNYVENSKTHFNIKTFIFIFLITIFIIILFLLFFKFKNKRNRKRIKVLIILLMIIPANVFAINDVKFSNSDLRKVRRFLLSNNNSDVDIMKLDADKDNKISINDLIAIKINYNTPNILISDGSIEKNNNYNYYSNVNKKVEINSLSDLNSVKYCFADDDYCEPNIDYDFQSNNIIMNIKFNNDKKPQRLCVKASNVLDLESTQCDTVTYLVDNKRPELKVKSNKIYMGEDDKYDLNTNVEPIYGVSGGRYKCDGKIDYGNNSIKCIITGNNGLKTEVSYEIIKSITYHKSAIFFGDSITFGYANNGYGWGNYIGDNYDFSSIVNAGKSGWFISKYLNRDWIVDIVKTQSQIDYDYVILHGGCNDINKNVPIGTYSNNDFSGNYDVNTFIGGLEYYLYTVTTNWPHAKLGYIINYQTPNDPGRNNEKSAPYYNKMKEVLNKWNISYLDLFEGKDSSGRNYSDILKVNTNEYLPDNLHLNGNGYKAIYPYIYNWMIDLEKYS